MKDVNNIYTISKRFSGQFGTMFTCIAVILLIGLSTCARRCPRGINSLAGYAEDEYTDCSGEEPVIRKCGEGLTYSKEKGECHEEGYLTKRSWMSEIHERVAMGEVVRIGSLFDVRKGMLYNGFNMWNKDTLEAKMIVREAESSTTKYLREVDDRDKAKNMEISADVELDFLSGLLSIEGSAKYINDHKKTTNKARVVMKAQVTNNIYDIDMNTPIDNENLCNLYHPNSGPTHVVVRIHEGLRAFFVFDKLVDDVKKSHDINGNLEAHVMLIPGMSVEGSVVLDSKGSEVTNLKNLDVQFYGDALLAKFPVTYTEAAIAYKETMENAPKKTPISFHLLPISKFCPASELAVVDRLTLALTNKASQYIADLSGVEAQVNTLLAMDIPQRYESVRNPLDKFKSQLKIFTSNFKSQIADEIPKIKSEEKHESVLSDILVEYEESSFEKTRSLAFLRRREREINIMSVMIENVLKDPFMSLSDHINAKDNECMFNGQFGNVLILGILPTEDITDNFLNSTGEYKEDSHWFEEDGTLFDVSILKNSYESYAKVNSEEHDKKQCFLLKLQESTSNEVHEIHLLKGGTQFDNDFEPPSMPPKPECPEEFINSDSFKIISEASDSPLVTGTQVILEKVTAGDSIIKHITVDNTDSFVIDNLLPYSQYRISTRYIVHTDQGYSNTSPYTDCITRPTSPPSVLSAPQTTSNSLTLTWYKPDKINPALTNKPISYNLEIYQGDTKVAADSTTDISYLVNNLLTGTVYKVSISAQLQDEEVPYTPSLVVSKEFTTGPPAPSALGPHYVSAHMFKFHVTIARENMVYGAVLDKILVRYYRLDAATNEVVPGTQREVIKHIDPQVNDTTSNTQVLYLSTPS